MSRRPGLGYQYLETHADWHKKDMKTYTEMNGFKKRLPRYYKEKFFDQHDRRMLAKVAVGQTDMAYAKEVDRLSAVHSDPHNYLEEKTRSAHDLVKSKSNQNSKF